MSEVRRNEDPSIDVDLSKEFSSEDIKCMHEDFYGDGIIAFNFC